MKIVKSIILVISLSFFISCTSPQTYLNKAVDIIETNSINKNSIDWVQFRKDVLEMGKEAKSIKETYPAIRIALSNLGDNHSHLLTPEQVKNMVEQNKPLPVISTEFINNNVGYIKIPGFTGQEELANTFAKQLQGKIKELDNKSVQSWIIDLSDDNGGNMWPMLLGLGPILGEGILGYRVDAEKKYTEWIYFNGTVFLGKHKIMKLDNPYILKNNIKKIAIIISHKTSSSGEAIALAFIGAKNTRFFGGETHGLSTGNIGHKLSDGAMIILTEGKFADRNKKIYGVPITPDVVDFNGTAKKTAIEWINNK